MIIILTICIAELILCCTLCIYFYKKWKTASKKYRHVSALLSFYSEHYYTQNKKQPGHR